MDEIDRLILRTLQEDGRTPFTQIAKRAGVSETTIRSRYRNLVDQGVVRTVSIVDPYALDFQAPAILGISVEPGRLGEVAEAIASLSEVSYMILVLGSYDIVAEIYCKNLPDLTELIRNQIQLISGVESTDLMMVTKVFKLSYKWSPAPEGEDSNSE
jgi:Lrp/AsnC family transcriptional regulator, regulator for asnA, asnC and gidA